MYVLKPGIKSDPNRRWALPDRIVFGHGACPILAGTYLNHPPLAGFSAEWIIPKDGLSGNHIYVTDGKIAFDYHGYSALKRLLEYHRKGWSRHHSGWDCVVVNVDFDLLSTIDLNQRKMLGPDQYLFDPISRARRFIERINHKVAAKKAAMTIS